MIQTSVCSARNEKYGHTVLLEVTTPRHLGWWIQHDAHLYACDSRSVPERTCKRLVAKVRADGARYTRYLFKPASRADEERLSLGVMCLPRGHTVPVSRVRARETESYWEWRVPGEISKFPFNGIIKRSAERERGIARGRPMATWHSVNSRGIPQGPKRELSRWQREMTADFQRIIANHGILQEEKL